MPAPPVRMRSEKVPWGTRCSSIWPWRTISSRSLFSPTYVPMCFRIWPLESNNPMPNPSTPALLLMVVRFLTPFFTKARIRFSGFPHSPKPPTMMLAPSGMSWTASSALRSEEHTSELQSHSDLVCRLLLEKKKKHNQHNHNYLHPKHE